MHDLLYAGQTEDRAALEPLFLRRLCILCRVRGCAIVAKDGRVLFRHGRIPRAVLERAVLRSGGWVNSAENGTPEFLLTLPLPSMSEQNATWLLVWNDEPRSDRDAYELLAHLTELALHSFVERRRIFEDRRRHFIEQASATARIGIWICTLPDETLTWSDGVYDLFEIPRQTPIDRAKTLAMYLPESARQMSALRAEAISTMGDFNFDAEIVTARGNHRWMRITSTVDGVGGVARKIFGMKQDITEEKRLAQRTRWLAETDTLTGLANRARFNARLEDLHGRNGNAPIGALVLIDLDNFKSINDTLGHVAGDQCLAEAGRRLVQTVPPNTMVARIGGDEFAILVDASSQVGAEDLSSRILEAFAHPFQFKTETRSVGLSLGIAHRTNEDGEALYHNADLALYKAKSSGRGAWRVYNAA